MSKGVLLRKQIGAKLPSTLQAWAWEWGWICLEGEAAFFLIYTEVPLLIKPYAHDTGAFFLRYI